MRFQDVLQNCLISHERAATPRYLTLPQSKTVTGEPPAAHLQLTMCHVNPFNEDAQAMFDLGCLLWSNPHFGTRQCSPVGFTRCLVE